MAGKTSKMSAKVAKKAAANAAKPRKAVAKASGRKPTKAVAKPILLAGGNPQIAKADGDAPVQAYIAAMPGWKSDVGRRLDALIARTVPGVRKAVKWNSPFHGVEGQGWFCNFHCFTKYLKVAFFRGTSLRPLPPGESKHKEVRYVRLPHRVAAASSADCRSGAPQSAASWEHDHEKTQARPGPGRPDLQRGHRGRPSCRTGHELVLLDIDALGPGSTERKAR